MTRCNLTDSSESQEKIESEKKPKKADEAETGKKKRKKESKKPSKTPNEDEDMPPPAPKKPRKKKHTEEDEDDEPFFDSLGDRNKDDDNQDDPTGDMEVRGKKPKKRPSTAAKPAKEKKEKKSTKGSKSKGRRHDADMDGSSSSNDPELDDMKELAHQAIKRAEMMEHHMHEAVDLTACQDSWWLFQSMQSSMEMTSHSLEFLQCLVFKQPRPPSGTNKCVLLGVWYAFLWNGQILKTNLISNTFF